MSQALRGMRIRRCKRTNEWLGAATEKLTEVKGGGGKTLPLEYSRHVILADSGTSFALPLIRTNRHHVLRIRNDAIRNKGSAASRTHSGSGPSPTAAIFPILLPRKFLTWSPSCAHFMTAPVDSRLSGELPLSHHFLVIISLTLFLCQPLSIPNPLSTMHPPLRTHTSLNLLSRAPSCLWRQFDLQSERGFESEVPEKGKDSTCEERKDELASELAEFI